MKYKGFNSILRWKILLVYVAYYLCLAHQMGDPIRVSLEAKNMHLKKWREKHFLRKKTMNC